MAEAQIAGSAAADDEEDGEPTAGEPPFPSSLPPGLRSDWPAPRRAVLGTRGGILAQLECAVARAALSLLSLLPLWLRAPLVGALARAAKAIDRRRSEAARVFLRQALGADMGVRELEGRVLQAWRHLLHVTLDAEALHRHVPLDRIREHLEVEMCEDARRILESRRGCIVATAHVGDWETGAAAMPWIGFDPFYVVSKPPKNRPLSVHAQRLREQRGVRLLPRRGAMKDAAAVIRGGGALALMLDQRARKRPVMAPFFGRRARCDRSAAVLLKRLRAPVVFVACYRAARPWRWRIEIPKVFRPEDLEGRSVEAITEQVNRELERLILAAPEQYFWLHDRYRGA
jgi:KDO2-lipid IV(A) lauroyltransferase